MNNDPSLKAEVGRADVGLLLAMLGPLAVFGALILVGVDIGVAVCIMFVSVFAVTTTLDAQWVLQTRRGRRTSPPRTGTCHEIQRAA